MDYRHLAPSQLSRIFAIDIDTAEPHLLFETDELLLEAPNWTTDGRALILNGNGQLWRYDLDSRTLEQIHFENVPDLNNDHVLDPDGETVYLSANDWHIYRGSLTGGAVQRVTNEIPRSHFLHGISPDGQTLAYVGLEPVEDDPWGRANIFTIPSAGGPDVRLTDSSARADGCEYSPDGEWIYFNTEYFSDEPGHAQIARMRPNGTGLEQLTFDNEVNWFPHWAPDGRTAAYLSFPAGTTGHPADLPVTLKIVRDHDWSTPVTVAHPFGGQGTINVNSWSPDSRRFAYLDYPIVQS